MLQSLLGLQFNLVFLLLLLVLLLVLLLGLLRRLLGRRRLCSGLCEALGLRREGAVGWWLGAQSLGGRGRGGSLPIFIGERALAGGRESSLLGNGEGQLRR